MDAGGGSVEVILVHGNTPVELDSLKLGVSRLSEQFIKNDPPSSKELQKLDAYVGEHIDPILRRAARLGVRRVVATSGTLLSVITIAGHLEKRPPDGHLNNFVVTADSIRKVRRLVCKADRNARSRIAGLDAKRVELIIPGACLADYVATHLRAKEVIACTWALREGVLLDFITRHQKGIAEVERYPDVRHRSVARFTRHLGETEEHGAHVARLALRLFDQLMRDLTLSPEAREWLELAALMHDVGHHISHSNHQRHTYYLITNSELLGFHREEIEIIAQVARYHRKAPPKDADPEFFALPATSRRVVRALAAILRVADALDRSHYGVVRDVRVRRRDKKLILQLDTAGEDAALEIWDARERARLLQQVLGLDVDFRLVR
jgi:exopolyphosphatase/guanosine-5'-triphosphate,3'-diphosphate pyrophosphatase